MRVSFFRIIRYLLYCAGFCIVFFAASHLYISNTIETELERRGMGYHHRTRSLLGLNYYQLTGNKHRAERLHIPFVYPLQFHVYEPQISVSSLANPKKTAPNPPSSLPVTIFAHQLHISSPLFPLEIHNLSGTLYPNLSLINETLHIEQTPENNIVMKGRILVPSFPDGIQSEITKEGASIFMTAEIPSFSYAHPLLSSHFISIPASQLHISMQEETIHARLSMLDSLFSFDGSLKTEPLTIEGTWNSTVSLSTLHTVFPLSDDIQTSGAFKAKGSFSWPNTKWDITLLPSEFTLSGILFDAIELKNGTFSHTSPSTLTSLLSGPQSPNWVPYSQLGWLPLTAVAAEDTSFWSHPGYSISSIQEAIDDYSRKGTIRGGSTITQQLAKNLFLSSEKTLERKVHEFLYTLSLEQFLSKEEIITTYLNIVEFGPNIHGAKKASSLYFLKQPKSLTLVEASYLASVLPAPTRFFHIAQEAKNIPRKKTDNILENLYLLKKISKEQYHQAIRTPLVVLPPNE